MWLYYLKARPLCSEILAQAYGFLFCYDAVIMIFIIIFNIIT